MFNVLDVATGKARKWLNSVKGALYTHITNQASYVIEITPSDATVYDPPLIGLRVGTLAGAVSVVSAGETVVIPSVQLYESLSMEITQILAATTATGITGWQGKA